MERPPPVPPKDAGNTPKMDIDRPSTALTSGSKRKRHVSDDSPYAASNSESDFLHVDEQTPKRSRSHFHQDDASGSEYETPAQDRLRRKTGSRNLSNLNLRHAAKTQPASLSPARMSKFQEGSLTDKPSEKPPSVFIRLDGAGQVHTAMTDYEDGMATPDDPADLTFEHSETEHTESNNATVPEVENKGFFQFGRKIAANFHPVTLWKSIWNDSKEELAREMLEEQKRKAKQKAEAEVRYAHMKQHGQLELQPLRGAPPGYRFSAGVISTPRDSGIAFDSLHSSIDQERSASGASGIMPPEDDMIDVSGVEIPGSNIKTGKGLRDRLHLKKPSLSNMRSDLKRMSSNISLAGPRESSSSVSPVKTDFDNSTLRASASKFDLKKQQKLSKRVSDLESKLLQARKDLDEALVEASPAPKLTGKYERFTATGTVKRAKFQPGKLPSLPSERVLMAEQMKMAEELAVSEEVATEASERRNAMELKQIYEQHDGQEEEGVNEETIKPPRARQYPTRASSLFNLNGNQNNDNIENQTPPDSSQDQTSRPESAGSKHNPIEVTENMNPTSIIDELTNDAASTPAQSANYSALDAKLKALDTNVKTARRASKPKKRKSAANDDHKLFKPSGTNSDDELEWKETTPKKKQKRKSDGKFEPSPPNTRASRVGSQTSPGGKKGKASAATMTKDAVAQGAKQSPAEPSPADGGREEQDKYSADEYVDDVDFRSSHRNSIDSQSMPLDPVYEEEEELASTSTSLIPMKDAPSKPTAKATPARYGRRSRSASPQKRGAGSVSVGMGAEEMIITRAARSVQASRSGEKRSKSRSPPPPNGYKTVVGGETVSVIPGQDGVPKLPKGANGSSESFELESEEVEGDGEGEVVTAKGKGNKKDEDWQWPDDLEVF